MHSNPALQYGILSTMMYHLLLLRVSIRNYFYQNHRFPKKKIVEIYP